MEDKLLIKQRIRELINIIYNKYSRVGGELHFVLDNNNIEDYNIQWCLDNGIAEIENKDKKEVYSECARLLLKLSYTLRKRLLKEKVKFLN